ncbi:1-phosphatidylinositol phosphodiesterase precursor [Amniculicola lignicola CBS 123094]|uniref:1-phosphatidylinositol phosphodiesterase n=1 Tax=Amniculicola lignicola CBS 123094 TaxID=1392246 RepID=A0A6A5WLS0_9PLEO|nr:1-phosphatidylinositol phosphodiesterase precursor [Amniculicola lignicola CBS 123094]
MAVSLTVRNLSSARISLKHIEQFEDPSSRTSKASAFSFASKNKTSLAPLSGELDQHSRTFKHEDLGVTLSPFESCTLKLQKDAVNTEVSSFTTSSTLYRLTVETPTGERHRIDTNPTYTQKASQPFTPLTPNPSTTFTALYHPTKPTPHLSIHTNHAYDLATWMKALSSTLPLSAISIPGTHNSHTHYHALPSVRCQMVPVQTQLENGIRFLDIRVQPSHAEDASKKELYLVHGAFPVSLTGTKYLEPMLKTCYEFLEKHPTETILVSLKREGVGSSTDELLSQILEQHYFAPNKSIWHTSPRLPYLGDVRGKLVLVRRYHLHADLRSKEENESRGTGLDATSWPHNSTHALHGPFCVQDFCEVMVPSDIPTKLLHSNDHLVRAAECTALIPGINTDKTNPVPPGPLYLNFLSGSNFWRVGCWPGAIAGVVNRGVEEWLCGGHHLEGALVTTGEPGKTRAVDGGERFQVMRAKRGDGGTGVVIMDHVGLGGDWELVRLVVGMNMGVLGRVRVEG